MGQTGPGIPGKGGQEGGRGQPVLSAQINLKNGMNNLSRSYTLVPQRGLISLDPIPKVFWVAPGKTCLSCGLL